MSLSPARWVGLVLALAPMGCSSGGAGDAPPADAALAPADAGPTDAGPTDAALLRADTAHLPAGDGPPTSIGKCDPAQQDCPAGRTCDLVCGEGFGQLACREIPAGGGVPVGGPCKLTEECAAGSGCYASQSAGSTCVRYCVTNADCTTGTCQQRSVIRLCPGGPQFIVKLCLP